MVSDLLLSKRERNSLHLFGFALIDKSKGISDNFKELFVQQGISRLNVHFEEGSTRYFDYIWWLKH